MDGKETKTTRVTDLRTLSTILQESNWEYLETLFRRARFDVNAAVQLHYGSETLSKHAVSLDEKDVKNAVKQSQLPETMMPLKTTTVPSDALPNFSKPTNTPNRSHVKVVLSTKALPDNCELILNALPESMATELLAVMLKESQTWHSYAMPMFERMVQAPRLTAAYAFDTSKSYRRQDLAIAAGKHSDDVTPMLQDHHAQADVSLKTDTSAKSTR